MNWKVWRDSETDDSCDGLYRFSASSISSSAPACFSRKFARSTKTVSAVSPDTDGNKPVTLHGQHPGHQLTALTQSEVDHLGQTFSHKLEPAEQLNSPLPHRRARQVSPTQSWVCPHLTVLIPSTSRRLTHNLASRSHPPKHPLFQCRPTRQGRTAAPEEERGAAVGSLVSLQSTPPRSAFRAADRPVLTVLSGRIWLYC